MKMLDEIVVGSKQREESREGRHQETLFASDRAIDVLSQKMDQLMNILKKE